MYRAVFQEHRLDATQVRGCWHQQGGSLVLWALPSAALARSPLLPAWRAHLSPVCCLHKEVLSACQPPDPQSTDVMAAPMPSSRRQLGQHAQREGLWAMPCVEAW